MLDLWGWGLVALGAFLSGLSKTGIAGLGILSVAIFASLLPAREAVGAVLIMLIAADVVAVSAYRHEASWGHLWGLFPWAALGVIGGALALGRIDDAGIRTLIGGILVALVGMHALRQRGLLAQVEAGPPRWIVRGTGLLAGFTTMVANASGPIMTLYLLGLHLPKFQFVGTAAWFFLVLNLFKVPFSYSLGMINPASLAISMRLIPFAIVGALFGRPLIARIDQHLFELLALGLTLVAGLRLLLI